MDEDENTETNHKFLTSLLVPEISFSGLHLCVTNSWLRFNKTFLKTGLHQDDERIFMGLLKTELDKKWDIDINDVSISFNEVDINYRVTFNNIEDLIMVKLKYE